MKEQRDRMNVGIIGTGHIARQHLACLRDCGLVSVRPIGRSSVYSLAQPALSDLRGRPITTEEYRRLRELAHHHH